MQFGQWSATAISMILILGYVKYMKHNHSLYRPASQEIRRFYMEPQDLLPHSQDTATRPCLDPVKSKPLPHFNLGSI